MSYFRVEYIKKCDGNRYWVNVEASTDIEAIKTITNRGKCTIVKCTELCEVPYSYIESDE